MGSLAIATTIIAAHHPTSFYCPYLRRAVVQLRVVRRVQPTCTLMARLSCRR